MPVSSFRCPELFFGNETASAIVMGNRVQIKVWAYGDYYEFDMDIDKLANFLDQCRQAQEESRK